MIDNQELSSKRKISIIMPVFNGEKYLGAAIESALGQTYQLLELIIINDGSTDQSDRIVLRYHSDPRLVYIKNARNFGVAASRNIALRHATGDLIVFLDQDDVWLPHKLEIQAKALSLYSEIGLLHARYARIDNFGDLLPYYKSLKPNKFESLCAEIVVGHVFEELFISNDIQPLTSMIPKAVLDRVGYFNEELPGVDDYELWLRIARQYPIGRVETILGYWRKHDTQQSNDGYKMLVMRLKAMDIFFKNDPNATQLVRPKIFINRMYGLIKGTGDYFFWVKQDYAKASIYYSRALRLKPYDLGMFFRKIYCLLPTSTRSRVRILKNRITACLRYF